ncbi:phospholipase DDHD1-like protein, partial [Trifolium pratense]
DKTFEHPYLQALGSHTNYWRDYDTALFILKHLYRDVPEELDSSIVHSAGSSRNDSRSVSWFDPRDTVEEDVPLTFSDKVKVRNFSIKAKRIFAENTASDYI